MKKIILSIVTIVSFVFADFSLVYTLDDQSQMIVVYKDAKHLKITTKDANRESSQLVVGNRHFLVMDVRGKKEYIDMDKANKELGQLGNFMGMSEEKNRAIFKILKKGVRKHIAGINAQEWTVEVDDNGQKNRIKVYVTDDKRFVNAIKKLSKATKSFYQNTDNMFANFLEIKKGYAIVQSDDMRLKSFDTKRVDDAIFVLPKAQKSTVKETKSSSKKALKACPIGGTGKKSIKLTPMLKEDIDGWRLVENQNCIDTLGMLTEGAVYKKGDEFTRITLSVNVDGEIGIIEKYKRDNMKMSGYKRGNIEGFGYQMAHVGLANEYVLDIKLPNAMLSIDSFTNKNLYNFAKGLKLRNFKATKKTAPKEHMQNAIKNIKIPKNQNTKELQNLMKQFQNMFGQ